jgi:hypothetical protein
MGLRHAPVTWLALAATASGCEVLFPLEGRPSDGPLPPAACPPAYQEVGESKYRFSSGLEQDWSDAATLCAMDSALAGPGSFTHLVVIGSDSERLMLEVFLAAAPSAWIGRSDRLVENTFLWVTLEDTGYVPPWEPGQPDNGVDTGEQDCLRVYPPGMDDDYCTQPQPYLCECDAYENQPSHYEPARR